MNLASGLTDCKKNKLVLCCIVTMHLYAFEVVKLVITFEMGCLLNKMNIAGEQSHFRF
jgi:hypothetical protein